MALGAPNQRPKKLFCPVAQWLFVRLSLLMHRLISFAKCSPVFFLLFLVKIYIFQNPLTHAPLLKSFHPLSATLMGFWGPRNILKHEHWRFFSISPSLSRVHAHPSWPVRFPFGPFVFPPSGSLLIALSLLTLTCLLKSKSLNTIVNHALGDLMEYLTLLPKIIPMKACLTARTHAG